LLGLLALCASPSRAQEPAGDPALRVRWEADPPLHGLQTVCGRVINDRPVSAGRVRLRVEGLDERGGVTSRRETEVVGQVPSNGSGLFCITMPAGAATYRVTVVSVSWMPESGSP
jgi:hypothetical protein